MATSSSLTQSNPSLLLWQREPQVLRRRLLWLMGVRLICSTLLMGGTVLFQLRNLQSETHPTRNFVFWLVGATYFLTLLYSLFFPQIKRLRRFAYLQLSADCIVVSLLVMSTGCHDSIFLFMYLLIIIGAAFLLYRSGAFLFAGISLVMLAIVLFGTMFEAVRQMPFVRLEFVLKGPELLYILVVHTPAFFLIAFLTSHLAEQVRHTGEILEQQQIDFDNLEALQKDIIDSLTSGLIATNMEGRVEFFNAFATNLIGIEEEHLRHRSLAEIFPELQVFVSPEPDARLAPLEKQKQAELTYCMPEGSAEEGGKRVLGCSVAPLHNRSNEQIGVLLLLQDLTPLKQIEAIAREREKLASVGGMAAGLAHEIRNPLSSLSGAVQLLRSELSLSGDDQLLMDIVVKETNRLNGLLSDFLLFARPKTIQKHRCDLNTLVQEAVYLFKQDKRYEHVEVSVDIPAPCLAQLDAEIFHQALWNLITNAAQAMLSQENGLIKIAATKGKNGTSVSITDNGPGIDEAIGGQIFEPFFSTKEGGTGLGLAVVRRIISEHGGHIEWDRSFVGGTRFFLYFPFEELSSSEELLVAPKSRDELIAVNIAEQRNETTRQLAKSEPPA